MLPADIVDLLRSLGPSERRLFLGILSQHDAAASVFALLPPPLRTEVLEQAGDGAIASLAARMPPDEAADLLGLLEATRADGILHLLDEKVAANLDRLMTYGR